MFISNRKLKSLQADVEYLKTLANDLEERIQIVESEVNGDEYKIWKEQLIANRETAAKQGYFFLNNKADTTLLERVIQEINVNEDLTALFKTADGATLSLRVHPQPTTTASTRWDSEE